MRYTWSIKLLLSGKECENQMTTVKESSALGNPVYPIMFAIGACHLLNDTLQAVIPAMFPVLVKERGFSFTQLGFIFFALNMVASVLQPVIGYISDRKPKPYALPFGMMFSLIGIGGSLLLQLTGY